MGFTGVDDPYEPPVDPEITLQGYGATPEENARRIIQHLEEEGYLTHPHTSAGRVPTPKGYRYFVESLMDEFALTSAASRIGLGWRM